MFLNFSNFQFKKMKYAFKILIKFCNFIPKSYLESLSYLSIPDVYNLSSTSKWLRNFIETHCKNFCENFCKINFYKTYFNQLMFSNCKFPKEIIRYVTFDFNKMKKFKHKYHFVNLNSRNQTLSLEYNLIIPSIVYYTKSNQLAHHKNDESIFKSNVLLDENLFKSITKEGFYPINLKHFFHEFKFLKKIRKIKKIVKFRKDDENYIKYFSIDRCLRILTLDENFTICPFSKNVTDIISEVCKFYKVPESYHDFALLANKKSISYGCRELYFD